MKEAEIKGEGKKIVQITASEGHLWGWMFGADYGFTNIKRAGDWWKSKTDFIRR